MTPFTHTAPRSDVIPSASVPAPVIVEDTSDNLDDLEFQYPETENGASRTWQPLPLPTGRDRQSSTSRNVVLPVNSEPHRSSPSPLPLLVMYPLPVHRVSVPKSPIVQQQSSRGEPRPVSNSRPPQTKPGRKCVTPHCNEVLPAESTASRCFPCVKREWRSKFQGKANGGLSRPHKWPKTVTWSDTLEVDSCAVKDAAKEDEPPETAGGYLETTNLKIRIPALRPLKSPPEPPTLPRESPPSFSEALDCKEIPASYTSPLPQPTDDSSIFTSSSPRLGETPPTSTVSTSPIFLHSKIGTTLKSPSPSPHKSEYSTSAALQFPATLSSTTRDTLFQSISGWDSDLTDLGDLTCLENSEVDEMSSSDVESAEERPSFKIRIPARPLSISVPQSGATICSISRCHRVLPVGYRWKCCVQCRLHHREYQRKRLNIRGKHKRLDEETDRDFITRHDPTAKPPPDFLTPGARLCTIRNCTQIIPSPEEYPWKMCEPCRIRMRDTSRRRRLKKLGQPGGQSTVEGVASTSQADVESGSESEDIPSVSKIFLRLKNVALMIFVQSGSSTNCTGTIGKVAQAV
ncbi:hypothetical protein J132_06420 [Termitomyces sp. J132]|nr:hypothetical protein J132_06420 [Termitomyces sp. J132]